MNTRNALHIGLALITLVTLGAACADDQDDGTMADSNTSNATGSGDTTAHTTADTGVGDMMDTDATDTDTSGVTTATAGTEDLEMQAEDFTCIQDWERVRRFRITNLLGHLDEALEVANSSDGGVYPVGTIIQLVPAEAMVKRREGWSPETNDWEFFFLEPTADGTHIVTRGSTDVVNAFGGNCLDCHAKAEPQWDFVCEQDHGCDPIPLGEDLINTLQDSDPRCP